MKPLEGITVLELSTYVAAPACGRVLKTQGARVIKLETPKGDVQRRFGPTVACPVEPDENPIMDNLNGGKECVSIDMRTPEGMAKVHKLLEKVDVFITNTRPKALESMGLDYETIKEKYPKLIFATIVGYGEKGPWTDLPGLDGIAIFAKGGFLQDDMVDAPGNYPPYLPFGMGDLACGAILAGSISSALLAREKTGKGDYVSVSLYGTGLWMFSVMSIGTQYGYQWPRGRYQGGPMGVPYQTKDKRWILPVIVEYEKFFAEFCRIVHAEELIDDPRYNTKVATFDPANREACIRIFEKKIAELNIDEVLPKMVAADMVVSELTKYKDNHRSEQALANGYMREITYNSGKNITLAMPPIHFDSVGFYDAEQCPPIGADNERIFKEFGIE